MCVKRCLPRISFISKWPQEACGMCLHPCQANLCRISQDPISKMEKPIASGPQD